MATFRKRGNRQWEAQIRKKGYPNQSKTFHTRKEAEEWANIVESKMVQGLFMPTSEAEQTTFNELARKYDGDKVFKLKSARQIRSDLKVLVSHFGDYALIAITPPLINSFMQQQEETEDLSSGTIRKRVSLLGRVLKAAIIDYGINLPHGNPVDRIRLPEDSKPRTRRAAQEELDAIIAATESIELPAFLVIQVETAMRRSESLQGASWQHVNLDGRTLLLTDSKNGEPRTVPLSTRAVAALKSIPRRTSGRIFGNQPDSMTQAFGRAVTRARKKYEHQCQIDGVEPNASFLRNLRLHDIRHEATSRLFERDLNVMEAAAVSGHKDLKSLKRYTHLDPQKLAEKLG